MRALLWRWAGPGIVFLVGLGFELIGDFSGSRVIAYGAFLIAGAWLAYLFLWPYIKRWRPLTLVPVDGGPPPATMRSEEWENLPLTRVADATFQDQEVPLDGFAYDRCIFVRCTFVYKGAKPFSLKDFTIKDDWNVEVDSAQLHYFSTLLNALRFLSKDIEVADELQPSGPVAYGEVQRPAKPGYWDNRQMLHAALKDFGVYSDGLDNEDWYEDDEVEEWESRVSQLISEALGQEWVDRFLTNDDRITRIPTDASSRYARLEYRRSQLGILIQVVNSLSPLEIRSDFDGRKWVGSEQFRFKQ